MITGSDLIRQLSGRDLGERLLLPCNMLRQGENVFLDDVTVEEVEKALKTQVFVVDTPGLDFCRAVLDENVGTQHRRRQIYEQTDCGNCRQA